MSFVSSIIDTAERVPLPDLVIRSRHSAAVLAHRDTIGWRQRR